MVAGSFDDVDADLDLWVEGFEPGFDPLRLPKGEPAPTRPDYKHSGIPRRHGVRLQFLPSQRNTTMIGCRGMATSGNIHCRIHSRRS